MVDRDKLGYGDLTQKNIAKRVGRVHELQICSSFVPYVCLFGVFLSNKYWLALNFASKFYVKLS